METGTGKTYVYIKTMFELNKRYANSKFFFLFIIHITFSPLKNSDKNSSNKRS